MARRSPARCASPHGCGSATRRTPARSPPRRRWRPRPPAARRRSCRPSTGSAGPRTRASRPARARPRPSRRGRGPGRGALGGRGARDGAWSRASKPPGTSNGVSPDATQSFTLTVNEAPAITSADRHHVHGGHGGQLHGHDDGIPTRVADRDSGALPAGVTLHRQRRRHRDALGHARGGHGRRPTRSPSRRPTACRPDATQIVHAHGSTRRPRSPAPTATTFTAGQAGSFTVTTTGVPTAVADRARARCPPA